MSGLLLGMVLSVWTCWFHSMVTLPPRPVSTDFGTCSYQCYYYYWVAVFRTYCVGMCVGQHVPPSHRNFKQIFVRSHILFWRHKNITEIKIAYIFISVTILLLKNRRVCGISVTPTTEFRALILLFSIRYWEGWRLGGLWWRKVQTKFCKEIGQLVRKLRWGRQTLL